MTDKPGTHYCYSFDEEHYQGEFSTRDDAIAEATAGHEPRRFWTGVAVPPRLESLMPDADWMIDSMRDAAADQVGADFADGWLDAVTKQQRNELQIDINKVIEAWLTKHNELPNFYSVGDVQEHAPQTPRKDGDVK